MGQGMDGAGVVFAMVRVAGWVAMGVAVVLPFVIDARAPDAVRLALGLGAFVSGLLVLALGEIGRVLLGLHGELHAARGAIGVPVAPAVLPATPLPPDLAAMMNRGPSTAAAVEAAPGERLVETYRGVQITRGDAGFFALGTRFASAMDARAAIDAVKAAGPRA